MKRPLKVQTELPAIDAAELLSQISLGLMHGALTIKTAGEQYACHPGPVVKLELKAQQGDTGGEMHIELSWKAGLAIMTA
jgi:amphi-Trp domain-containing protein